MGLLDNLRSALGGPKFLEVPLEPGESLVLEKFSGLLVGGKSLVGGKLVLTDRRLLFLPWDVRAVGSLLAQGLTKVGVPGVVGTAIGKVSEFASEVREARLESVTRAWPSRDEALFSPPGIAVQVSGGRVYEFGILAKKLSLNPDPSNRPHRDQMLAAITSAISA